MDDWGGKDESDEGEFCEALLRGDYESIYRTEDSGNVVPCIEYDHKAHSFLIFDLHKTSKRLVKVQHLNCNALLFLSSWCSLSTLASEVTKCRDS